MTAQGCSPTHCEKKKGENKKKCRLVRSRNRTLRSTKCTVHWMEYTLREGMEDSLWIWCMYACMQNLRERGCLPTSTLLSNKNNPHNLQLSVSYSYRPDLTYTLTNASIHNYSVLRCPYVRAQTHHPHRPPSPSTVHIDPSIQSSPVHPVHPLPTSYQTR